MKKVALITNVILLAIVSIACKQNKPEPVVEKYYTHFYRGEFEKIQNYVMEEHYSYYALLKQLSAGEKSEDKDKPEVKVTDIKCEITGDTVAVCSCLVKIGEESQKQTVQLKKVKKAWLVNQGKEGDGFFSPQEEDETEIDTSDEYEPIAVEED
jgi:hypothetical protein